MAENRGTNPLRELRRYFFAGLAVWVPLGAVYLAIHVLYSLIRSWFFPGLEWEPRLLVLTGIAAVLVATGWMATRLHMVRGILRRFVDAPAERIPGIRWVYTGVKRLVEAMLRDREAFGKVVLIEYPRRGAYSLAFQMAGGLGEVQDRVRERRRASGDDDPDDNLMAVFVPTTPNPTSGFVLTLPKKDVTVLDMTREQALQMIISLGVVVPQNKTTTTDAPNSQGTPSGSTPRV